MDIVKVNKKKSDATEVSETQSTKKKLGGSKFLPWILLVVVLAGGLGATFYYKNRADKVESDPAGVQQQKNQQETDRIMTKLRSAIVIEETDKPTVARVDDPEKLKKSNETFYKNVQKGDYLIIFPKRAIIYREDSNQIVNIAPIINTADLQQDAESESDETEEQTDGDTAQ